VDERGRRRAIPGGYTGRIREVNAELVKKLLGEGYLVVVSPIALSLDHELLNVDADQAAAKIAGALKAEKLLILTDVEGVIVDEEVLREIKVDEVEALKPKIGVGMNRKVLMCSEAVKQGVGEAIIASGLTENPLIALEEEQGTRIKP